MPEEVILVDEEDREIGKMEKIRAHQEGRLHRAFSIFIFSPDGRMLIQKRAKEKYHCGGLWANACCSHPRPGETLEEAVHRRLREELGFDTELKEAFHFIYRATFPNGLTENEFDHVFIGFYSGPVQPNKEEVEEIKWVAPEEILEDMRKNPERYTPWFRIALEKVLEKTKEFNH